MSVISKIKRVSQLAVTTFKDTLRYKSEYNSSFVSQYRRLLQLYEKDHYSREEVSILGIADPRIPASELQQYISKYCLLGFQYCINDVHDLSLTENKAIFYSLCDSLHIPSPRLYAHFSPHEGWLKDGSIMRGQSQWVDYFERRAPRELIIKPSMGVYAQGFKMLEKREQKWHCKSGKTYSSLELYQDLTQHSNYDRFILQERVRPHDDFTQLSDSEALHTVRVVTLIDKNREPQILSAVLKIVQGNNTTDNFNSGDSGNRIANIDTRTGRILTVLGKQNGSLDTLSDNQRTGMSYCEFTLPAWEEVRMLALDAAIKFSPVRTIGWDIAISNNGPLVIEGNQYWDPSPNYFKEAHILREHFSL